MHSYFAAANTAEGFVGWFDDIFDPRSLDFIYIIKGGSGTGKSTLMKKVAAKATEGGAECEYFYCSSDPTSLDGIIMTMPGGKKLAMLDGTAPHTRDPKYPGATEKIVNLGEYWCDDILKGQKKEIFALSDKKSALFTEAYEDFKAAALIYRMLLAESKRYLLEDKLMSACTRLLKQRMAECRFKGGVSHTNIRALSALSTKGEVYFDSFSDCERVYLAVDFMDTVPFLFDALARAAVSLGINFDRAPMPLCPHLTEAIRFPQLSMSVVSASENDDVKPINMSRFVDKTAMYDCDRHRRRLLRKTARELTDSGLDKLRAVNKVHASIEKIYIGAMDFTRLEEASERLIKRIFA